MTRYTYSDFSPRAKTGAGSKIALGYILLTGMRITSHIFLKKLDLGH